MVQTKPACLDLKSVLFFPFFNLCMVCCNEIDSNYTHTQQRTGCFALHYVFNTPGSRKTNKDYKLDFGRIGKGVGFLCFADGTAQGLSSMTADKELH